MRLFDTWSQSKSPNVSGRPGTDPASRPCGNSHVAVPCGSRCAHHPLPRGDVRRRDVQGLVGEPEWYLGGHRQASEQKPRLSASTRKVKCASRASALGLPNLRPRRDWRRADRPFEPGRTPSAASLTRDLPRAASPRSPSIPVPHGLRIYARCPVGLLRQSSLRQTPNVITNGCARSY